MRVISVAEVVRGDKKVSRERKKPKKEVKPKKTGYNLSKPVYVSAHATQEICVNRDINPVLSLIQRAPVSIRHKRSFRLSTVLNLSRR